MMTCSPPARWLRHMAVAAVCAVSAAVPAAAQTSVANFNTLTEPGNSVRYVDNCYLEANLRFTVVGDPCGAPESFATWGSADGAFYSGSPALFLNSATGSAVDIGAANGAMFSLLSIDMTSVLGLFGNPTMVLFQGTLFSGGSVMRTVNVPGGSNTPTNFTFNDFTGLSSVRMMVSNMPAEPYVQFDNVSVSVVPEPASIALMGVGLVLVGAMARRRKALS